MAEPLAGLEFVLVMDNCANEQVDCAISHLLLRRGEQKLM